MPHPGFFGAQFEPPERFSIFCVRKNRARLRQHIINIIHSLFFFTVAIATLLTSPDDEGVVRHFFLEPQRGGAFCACLVEMRRATRRATSDEKSGSSVILTRETCRARVLANARLSITNHEWLRRFFATTSKVYK
jgi:hypothetical protein